MNPLENKVSIVTGGGAGIGQAICEELSRRGSRVIVADVNKSDAEHVVDSIIRQGGQARALQIDVTKEEDVKNLVDGTVSDYGHLDYIFNNAGIAIGGEARDLDLEQWRKVMDVDFNGVLYGTLAAYRVMVRQGFGHIVNTSSATGLSPQPGNAPYCTSKHAVVGLSLSLRFEGADLGVKVSVVCPGYVRTNIYGNMEMVNVSREQWAAVVSRRKQMEPADAARIILDGVARNRGIIIFPGWVRWAWRLYRLFPGIFDGVWLRGIRELRKYREGARP